MRIAFASCMYNRVMSDQAVWAWIQEKRPDHLILLGDSLYLDLMAPKPPQLMEDDEFAQHLFQLYGELRTQPQLESLIQSMPNDAVSAIWDDHDFLWNDAMGSEVKVVHKEKIRLTTAFMEAFRATINQSLAVGSYPYSYLDARFWNLKQPTLSTPTIHLSNDLKLHLSDGRTYRTRTWLLEENKRNMFDALQRGRFTAAIYAAPDAIHLFASGSTIGGYRRYSNDLGWLTGLAAEHRILVLSGDIHRNAMDVFITSGLPLHEATSSGAGVKDAVVVGSPRNNYGMLEIDADSVTVELFNNNVLESRRILDRQTWLAKL